jgi:hypothetical protein
MSTILVNGYVLVSLSDSSVIYKGPDRAPWEVVDEDYYEAKLPPPSSGL